MVLANVASVAVYNPLTASAAAGAGAGAGAASGACGRQHVEASVVANRSKLAGDVAGQRVDRTGAAVRVDSAVLEELECRIAAHAVGAAQLSLHRAVDLPPVGSPSACARTPWRSWHRWPHRCCRRTRRAPVAGSVRTCRDRVAAMAGGETDPLQINVPMRILGHALRPANQGA